MAKKKVLIVGLPLFAKRLKEGLEKVDKENKYIALDTYYNNWHKFLALFTLFSTDVVYSINGTLRGSRLLDLAFKLNKKVIMHWVGSDVTTATEDLRKDQYNLKYLEAEHYTVAPWLKEELEKIGIKASLQSISGYEEQVKISPLPKKLKILAYLPEHRAEFYGKSAVLKAVEYFPEIEFVVVGSMKPIENCPPNLIFKGWVKDINAWINRTVATIRYMEHDGLSQLVLESLARGRYVFYNRKLEGVNFVENIDELLSKIEELRIRFESGLLKPNMKGAEMIRDNYSLASVMKDVKENIDS